MEERFKSVICADCLITKKENNNKYVLLMERKNTGFDDGMYELPGGHLEKNEDVFDAMIRELKEELVLDVKRDELKIIYIMHHYTGERMNFIFELDGKNLIAQIGEKDKCSDLKWFEIEKLPINLTPKVKKILNDINSGCVYNLL